MEITDSICWSTGKYSAVPDLTKPVLLSAHFNRLSTALGLHLWRDDTPFLVHHGPSPALPSRAFITGKIPTASWFLQEHKYIPFNASSSEDIWDMQILKKEGSKSGWMHIMWGLSNFVQFLEVTSLTSSLAWRNSCCPHQHTQNLLLFLLFQIVYKFCLNLLVLLTCTLAHLEWAPLWQRLKTLFKLPHSWNSCWWPPRILLYRDLSGLLS